MPKLRLVKVIVQPVFVLDDGQTLTEVPVETHTILPADWPTYSGERFPAELAATQAQLDAGSE